MERRDLLRIIWAITANGPWETLAKARELLHIQGVNSGDLVNAVNNTATQDEVAEALVRMAELLIENRDRLRRKRVRFKVTIEEVEE